MIHLTAESHVDRSISDPLTFVKTNVLGTINLLEAFKNLWQGNFFGKQFYHISTDEVYGTLGNEGLFSETNLMIQTHHILRLKRVQIILLEPMARRIIYLM